MNPEAAALIAHLRLEPLPDEGGFFRQTWLAAESLTGGSRAGAAIYFLITEVDFSALHLLRLTEIWHFYAGDPVEHLQLDPATGLGTYTTLGTDVFNQEIPQLPVRANVWQGARLAPSGDRGWALLGTTTVPAWTASEFASREDLIRDFPAYRTIIAALTR